MPPRTAATRAVRIALLALSSFSLTILPVTTPLKNAGPALVVTSRCERGGWE
jgi:hypothetical protein